MPLSGELFKGGGRFWRVFDWCHLMEHIGRNASNYFLYQSGGPARSPLPSELLHLNQAGV